MSPFAPKPPVEKLPLAVRKDIRDQWESKKADYESQIAGVLGFPVAININVNAVWAYGESLSATQAGSTFSGYIDGFISAAKSYTENYGDLGKTYFKNAVTKSEITVTVNELGANADTIAADVKDGVFRILFKHDSLGYNQSYLSDALVTAIDKASHHGFCLLAKHSIQAKYEVEIKTLHGEITDVLALPDLVLDPNFEENYAALLKKDDKDWQRIFGDATLDYFKNVKDQLITQGFNKDDMLQEGFAETVTKKTIKLRIVEKTKDNTTNESVLEDGVIYIQTTLPNWYYNVYYAGAGILDLL